MKHIVVNFLAIFSPLVIAETVQTSHGPIDVAPAVITIKPACVLIPDPSVEQWATTSTSLDLVYEPAGLSETEKIFRGGQNINGYQYNWELIIQPPAKPTALVDYLTLYVSSILEQQNSLPFMRFKFDLTMKNGKGVKSYWLDTSGQRACASDVDFSHADVDSVSVTQFVG